MCSQDRQSRQALTLVPRSVSAMARLFLAIVKFGATIKHLRDGKASLKSCPALSILLIPGLKNVRSDQRILSRWHLDPGPIRQSQLWSTQQCCSLLPASSRSQTEISAREPFIWFRKAKRQKPSTTLPQRDLDFHVSPLHFDLLSKAHLPQDARWWTKLCALNANSPTRKSSIEIGTLFMNEHM